MRKKGSRDKKPRKRRNPNEKEKSRKRIPLDPDGRSQLTRAQLSSLNQTSREVRGWLNLSRLLSFSNTQYESAEFMQKNTQQSKPKTGIRQRLKGLGKATKGSLGAATTGAATGTGLGWGVGMMVSKNPTSNMRLQQFGAGAGLVSGAAIGAGRKIASNMKRMKKQQQRSA